MQRIINTLRKVGRGEELKERFGKIVEYLQREVVLVRENRDTFYSVLNEIKESFKDQNKDETINSYKSTIQQLEY
jgi:hypothetical protein